MVSVEAAKRILKNAVVRMIASFRAVDDAAGYVLAADIRANYPMPLFDQSAVDGYALFITDPVETESVRFEIIGEIKAGDPPVKKPGHLKACRIYTGAPVPAGAFGVVMQEDVSVDERVLKVPLKCIINGSHIRRKGGHYGKGEVVLTKGQLLNPAAIGLLASLGITRVKTIDRPFVGVLVTGNELIMPGEKLKSGQIYDSNSSTLRAALTTNHFEMMPALVATDDRSILLRQIRKLLKDADVLIVTGGISVGKYDLVRETLLANGVQELFYKVAQKPGKPIFAGVKGRKLVFALPGNPAAVLVCYYQYVLPSLLEMSGRAATVSSSQMVELEADFIMKGDRDVFLRAAVNGGRVRILPAQDSDNLYSFAMADSLVFLPAGNKIWRKGELVQCYRLPFY